MGSDDSMPKKQAENTTDSLKRANTKLGLDNIKTNNIIFVYCPPRVGSTSLVSSLRVSASHLYKVLHIHDENMLHVVGGIENVSVCDIIEYNSSIGRNVYVIDIYREPLERKMSEFFGKVASFHFNNSINAVEQYSIERIIKRFNLVFPHVAEEDHFLEKYTPVIDNPPPKFDTDRGYAHIEYNGIHYIKLRLRDVSSWATTIGRFLDIDMAIIRDNERSSLPLNGLYERFKSEYKIPHNFLECIKESKGFRYYLTEKEQTDYIERLEAKSTEECIGFTLDQFNSYIDISTENQHNVDIEGDHYFDEGCVCPVCSQARRSVFHKIKCGEVPHRKIIHRILHKEFKLRKIHDLHNRLQQSQLKQRTGPTPFRFGV